jgi:hypothetical protein
LIIKSIFRSNKKIPLENIVSIEELTFYYGGRNSILYKGYFLQIVFNEKTFKTTSLNEKGYDKLRLHLKTLLKGKIKLNNQYTGENFSWLYLVILNIPTLYLIYKIINL